MSVNLITLRKLVEVTDSNGTQKYVESEPFLMNMSSVHRMFNSSVLNGQKVVKLEYGPETKTIIITPEEAVRICKILCLNVSWIKVDYPYFDMI